jgi:hypothetical protein
MTVQILRFKDGLDVICKAFVHDTESLLYGKIEIESPMIFEIRNQNLVLQHWLPLAVMKSNKALVDRNDVLCTLEPNDDFKEYYINTVKNLKKELREMKKERESGVDVMEAIAELATNKNINIH